MELSMIFLMIRISNVFRGNKSFFGFEIHYQWIHYSVVTNHNITDRVHQQALF